MDKAPQYRKKPVIIEAFQFHYSTVIGDMPRWFVEAANTPGKIRFINGCAIIETLEGDMKADSGDWIIQGVKGEIYPCKPDIFALTYEPAEPSPALAKGVTAGMSMPDYCTPEVEVPILRMRIRELEKLLPPPALGVLTGEEEEALESLNVNYEINTLADACQAYHLTKRKAHIVARALRRLRAASTQVGVKEVPATGMFSPNDGFTACKNCGKSPPEHWVAKGDRVCENPGACPAALASLDVETKGPYYNQLDRSHDQQ